MKKLFFLSLVVCMAACDKPPLPYEATFRRTVIEAVQIDPIIESIIVEATIDSSTTREYFDRELQKKKDDFRNEALVKYEKSQRDYNLRVRSYSKEIADMVYKKPMDRYKREYDNAVSGSYPRSITEFYEERLKYPTVFEQLTVKYRFQKDGALIVERYRTDIFKGDTTFFGLDADRTIYDYIK